MSAKRSDVAQKAGVSESTVSRALSDSPLISNETKRIVQSVAEELKYFPNKQAALFGKSKTARLGFVIKSYKSFPPFSRAYFPAQLDGTVLAADENGYSISIILDEQENRIKDFVRLVKTKEVDGLLLGVTSIDDARLAQLIENNIPFVLINNYKENCNTVANDPENGMAEALKHAAELNHRQIGYITGDLKYYDGQKRSAVLKKYLKKYNLSAHIVEGTFSKTNGYYQTAKLLQKNPKPTLIMTASDRAALGVLNYCVDHDIKVPQDLSVIGYDNLAPAADVTPALTTVNNPVTRIASQATRLLIDIIEGKSEKVVNNFVETKLIIRDSTAECPK
ncbi:MAG: LacI family DNA-binding transcriptional regulator [Calditrichaeota bacterium]|nr:LacI family DNA-binding transcriptional regulator [Calditrichota bacterium]